MKAVCALLCLALAQGISASIFKRSQQPLDDLIVNPLDYINQYQQPLYQPKEVAYNEYIRSQKQPQKQQKSKQQQKLKYKQPESSLSSSEETNERINNEQYGQEWTTPLFTTGRVMKVQSDVDDTPFTKNIVWSRDMQMPVQQKKQKQLTVQTDVDGTNPYTKNIAWSSDMQMPVRQKKQQQLTVTIQQEIQKIFAEAHQNMKHPTIEEKVQLQQAFAVAAATHNEDDHLNATELLHKYKYPVEEHTIKTDDGYVLTLFRIPPRKQNTQGVSKKPVVFLMHGLMGSADDWLLMGPGKSLAYLLSDSGFDVWLGNIRGNKYSRSHVSKHPALNDFWQFCNDEGALHDLPAMIDIVLKTSAQEKLYYVGHSQGTTSFFALVASRPEYNDKIISMHALAPMVFMKNTRSPLIRMMAPHSPFEASLHHEIGHGEFKPSKELIASVGGSMLQTEIGYKNVSLNVNFVIAGVNIDSLTPELTPVVLRHVPAGASTRMIKQYGQQVVSEDFRKYDFGPSINKNMYGSFEAPKYELEKVTAPVRLYYAEEDWLVNPTDVAKLQLTLPAAATPFKVPDKHFSHMDFQFSTKAPRLVYKELIESMNNNSDSNSNGDNDSSDSKNDSSDSKNDSSDSAKDKSISKQM